MDLGTAADTATAGANVEASSSSCADFVFDALIAALGTQRDRYATASELQSYSGIAPVLASSGKQHWVHWRWACPKFLRQTFHEWAVHSLPYSAWAKAYYDQQRGKGKPRNTVLRALAFKWIRILFRCWKDRKPYCEEIRLWMLHKFATSTWSSPVTARCFALRG